MEFVVNSHNVVLLAGVLTALLTIGGVLAKLHRWVIKQEMQDKEIEALKKHHDEDVKKIQQEEISEFTEIKEELQLLTYAVLACLKGLRENGADGPVIDAISKIEKHLNDRAHS